MGSLETGLSVKRDQHLLRPSSAISRNERNPFGQRPRSWLARLFIKKFDFLQCSCTIAVFFFFAILFQMLLLGSVVEKSENSWIGRKVASSDLMFWKEIGELDFGENVKFEPKKLLAKFQKESREVNASAGSRTGMRIGYRKPQLALVFANLLLDPQQILMATVAVALRDIGYKIEVYSLEDGPLLVVWTRIGVPVNILKTSEKKIVVDWLSYDGIIVNSIEAREVISCLLQEPFKSVPLIWSIHERTLATHLRQYMLSGKVEMAKDWQKLFNRSTVIVFPNYALPLLYSASDSGNYYVVPGSPAEVWEVDNFVVSDKDNLRLKLGFGLDDFIIAIVGSQFLYRGLWLEHAFILKALLPVSADCQSESDSYPHLKIIVMSGDSTSNYSVALETVAHNLKYPSGIVKHVAVDQDRNSILSIADLVIYGSFLEEPSFPDILIRAMSFGKPIIAPDLSMIRKYVDDRVNGYIFPKENIRVLTQIIMEVVLKGKLSSLARNIASIGKNTAKNLMVSEAVEGYASLIESVLKLPSEVAPPKTFTEISSKLKEEWQWRLFESITNSSYPNRTLRINRFLDNIEKQWNRTMESSGSVTVKDETFLYSIWEEQKHIDMANTRKRREEEELKDRTDQTRGTWEDVYRNVKRADRTKNDLHERDERELERTGQPLCIYEPYFGEGIWPFLHNTSLYRGLGLSSRGRRPGADDIDGPSRLPLLSNPYYRDALGEYGAFFAIANRIDRTHKNAWIGFQSWRATARKESLSKTAETALLDAIQARRHGDALYFWAPMDVDPRYQSKQDFWSFCDAINAGNCNFTVSEALKKMYGIKQNWTSLPPMPIDGDTWSVMHSWALPTKSFLEFIMFSRMFVDTLDAQFFEEHHRSGHCYLSLSKDKRCYTRVLELLVNVWAYHSARRMVYVNPETGVMQEQHKLKNRRGQMWVKWFSFDTLKSMDEELAEEFDSGWHKRRWLWPLTGEVFWQGMIEKERNQRNREKEKRRQQSKEKLLRMKKRQRQKTIGKYVKPPPEEMQDLPLNSTVATAKLLR